MREDFFMKSSTILSSELLPAAYLYKYIPERKKKFKYFVVIRSYDTFHKLKIIQFLNRHTETFSQISKNYSTFYSNNCH